MKKIFLLLTALLLTAVLFSCAKEENNGEAITVTFSIRVDNLLANLEMLDANKRELIPEGGFIFPQTLVTAQVGDTVFDILQRETRNARMHMAARFTPIINEAYVEAIHNIYAYDAGALSGWQFSVNGVFPGISSSSYEVLNGDVIVWAYTLNMGHDLGQSEW